MDYLLQGISFGLVLSIMIGPIFFALIQTGIERGFRDGVALGMGVWASDLLYIILVYTGVSYVIEITKIEGFAWCMGVVGGFILIGFGLASLITKPSVAPPLQEQLHIPDLSDLNKIPLVNKTPLVALFSLFLKGFLINTINPFNVFFWTGITMNVVVAKSLTTGQSSLFFLGLWGTVVFSDAAKIYLARTIQQYMKPTTMVWLKRISGIALILFGLIMILRVSFSF